MGCVDSWSRLPPDKFDDPNMAAAIVDRTVHHGTHAGFERDPYSLTLADLLPLTLLTEQERGNGKVKHPVN
jgi:hypothetical protein